MGAQRWANAGLAVVIGCSLVAAGVTASMGPGGVPGVEPAGTGIPHTAPPEPSDAAPDAGTATPEPEDASEPPAGGGDAAPESDSAPSGSSGTSPAPTRRQPAPGSAPAPATEAPSADSPSLALGGPSLPRPCDPRCRGRRVMRRSPVDPPPDWEVRFEGGRDGVLGTTSPAERLIRVFVREEHRDADLLFTLLHEYGHAYDIDHLDEARRRRWAKARGYTYERWSPSCHDCHDLDTPAGDWAESFAYCHTGDARRFGSQMAGVPTAEQCDLLGRLSLPPGHPDAPESADTSRCRGSLLGARCR